MCSDYTLQEKGSMDKTTIGTWGFQSQLANKNCFFTGWEDIFSFSRTICTLVISFFEGFLCLECHYFHYHMTTSSCLVEVLKPCDSKCKITNRLNYNWFLLPVNTILYNTIGHSQILKEFRLCHQTLLLHWLRLDT